MLHLLKGIGLENMLISGVSFFPATPKRLLSLLSPNSTEDVFDYGDKQPKLETFSKITYPLMVIIGGKDDVADRPVQDIKKVFDTLHTAKQYKSVIVPSGSHTYTGVEKQAVREIMAWAKAL
jgi:alpha-beta hydrolase superfamily lysophospholipase